MKSPLGILTASMLAITVLLAGCTGTQEAPSGGAGGQPAAAPPASRAPASTGSSSGPAPASDPPSGSSSDDGATDDGDSGPKKIPIVWEGKLNNTLFVCVQTVDPDGDAEPVQPGPPVVNNCQDLTGAGTRNAREFALTDTVQHLKLTLTWTAAHPLNAELAFAAHRETRCGANCVLWIPVVPPTQGTSPVTLEGAIVDWPKGQDLVLTVSFPDRVCGEGIGGVCVLLAGTEQPFKIEGELTVLEE